MPAQLICLLDDAILPAGLFIKCFFFLILFICHFCTLQEVSISIEYEKCVLLNYLRDKYRYLYNHFSKKKTEETVSGMMSSLIWKMMF